MYCVVAVVFLILFQIYSFQLTETFVCKKNYNEIANERNLKWIEQPLDHFDVNEKRKFRMRYYEDKNCWKPNGPIYLVISGESDKPFGNFTLFQKLAQEMNGLVIVAEHRYYGESMPPLDLNIVKNYQYLSSRQALADLAGLLVTIKSTDDSRNSKVIVTGCSYAGSLAVWMRVLYPNLIDAAVSNCATLNVKINAHELFEKVGDDYKKYGTQACYDKIEKIFNRYNRLFLTVDGTDQLKKEENICDNIDMKLQENKETFFMEKIKTVAVCAQMGSVHDIKQNCSALIRNEKFYPLDPIYNEIESCYNYSFAKYFNYTFFNQTARSWWYQLCTEFGDFPTATNLNSQPFSNSISLDFSIKQCMTLFGPKFDKKRVAQGIENTIKLYGGLHPNVTKVLFVNGGADIWNPLCILKPFSNDVRVITIPNSFHCDHHTSIIENGEPRELKDAKLNIINTVKIWSL